MPFHRHSELDQRVREKGLCLQVAKEVRHMLLSCDTVHTFLSCDYHITVT